MNWLSKRPRSVLTIVFGLLTTAFLISAGNRVEADPNARNLDPEIATNLTSDLETEEVSARFSRESLFDLLFGRRENDAIAYDVPFPFTALSERIAVHLAARDGKPSTSLQVLIPLGRSLQRYAAEPEYFKFPRVILAVDRGPTVAPGKRGLLLKDRLYLGYQEKARAIEVISYNTTAGRFEFQVVENYAPGLTPTVSYASRALCMGCHQNGGPIWSEPPWEETNGNPKIAHLLAEQNGNFHGVPINLSLQGTEAAFRISRSIERANLFLPHLQLWKEGCGKSPRCRGDLLAAMLQYRLSGKRGYHRAANSFEEAIKAAWQARWPEGLRVQSALIPNRDPLDDTIGTTGALDPLEPRPNTLSLEPSDAGAVENLVAGLSEFLPGPDIRSLDDYLFEARQKSDRARALLKTACAFTKKDLGDWALQVRFSCGSEGLDELRMAGQFYIEPGKETLGTIERLSIGESETLIKLAISGPEIPSTAGAGKVRLKLRQPIGDIHARLTNGWVLERMTLRWSSLIDEDANPSAELRRHPDNGMSVLSLVDDFAPLRAALTDLVLETEKGQSDALSGKPIQGGALMRALFIQLGMKRRQWCCSD